MTNGGEHLKYNSESSRSDPPAVGTFNSGASGFTIKDSGERREFEGGMVRDTDDDKINFVSLLFGPMLRRWADHLTKGRKKYPDPKPGVPNWTLAEGEEEYHRFRESAFRHFIAWLNDERDEDHAAGVFFNVNGAEYVRDKMTRSAVPPGAVITAKQDEDARAAIARYCRERGYDLPPGFNNGPET
jgi:hypothetical protein